MEKTIHSNCYSAIISTLGGEIISLSKSGRNILWNRDSRYWADSALVLFPFIGRNCKDTYVYRGKQYNIGLHGFSTKSEFEVIEESDNALVLQLTDNKDTHKAYPFNFAFKVKYCFKDDKLIAKFTIRNTSSDVMPFACGFHPGFMLDDDLDSYSIKFPYANNPKEICITTKCMLLGETKPLHLENDTLKLNKELFANSAKVYRQLGNTAVLLDKNENEIVKLEFDGLENIVLWQTLNSDAKFICIEGWRGLPGSYNHIDDISLDNNKTFLDSNEEVSYSATIAF